MAEGCFRRDSAVPDVASMRQLLAQSRRSALTLRTDISGQLRVDIRSARHTYARFQVKELLRKSAERAHSRSRQLATLFGG
jgi:hypothetical protein